MTVIAATDVTKRFGDLTAVDRITIRVEPGEVVGLLGANGAGKTTLMKMLLGLLPVTSGRITSATATGSRSAVGYVPQGLGLYPELTVRENVDFVADAYRVDPPVLEPELEALSDRLVAEIPLGMRRRTAFAAALSHHPTALILDEPTSGVGPLGRADLWSIIHRVAEEGAAVLVSTHYMEEAEECDRVVVMANGREVAAGPVSTIIGSLRSVSVAHADSDALDRLRAAGLTVLGDGRRWRVVNGDLDQVTGLVGAGASVEYVPATFEEAFVALST